MKRGDTQLLAAVFLASVTLMVLVQLFAAVRDGAAKEFVLLLGVGGAVSSVLALAYWVHAIEGDKRIARVASSMLLIGLGAAYLITSTAGFHGEPPTVLFLPGIALVICGVVWFFRLPRQPIETIAVVSAELGFSVESEARTSRGILEGLPVRLRIARAGRVVIEVEGGPTELPDLPDFATLDSGLLTVEVRQGTPADAARDAAKRIADYQQRLAARFGSGDTDERQRALREATRLRAITTSVRDAARRAASDADVRVRLAAHAVRVAHGDSTSIAKDGPLLVAMALDESVDLATRREAVLVLRAEGSTDSLRALRAISAPPALADEARRAAISIESRSETVGRVSVVENDGRGTLSRANATAALSEPEND